MPGLVDVSLIGGSALCCIIIRVAVPSCVMFGDVAMNWMCWSKI